MSAIIGLMSGRTVTIDDKGIPDLREFQVTDLLRGYRNIKRFGGQMNWNLERHVGHWFPSHRSKADQRHWFLHEVAETLGVGDINFQIKWEWAPNIRGLEETIFNHAARHFFPGKDVTPFHDGAMKRYDLTVGNLEVLRFFPANVAKRMLDFYGFEADPDPIILRGSENHPDLLRTYHQLRED